MRWILPLIALIPTVSLHAQQPAVDPKPILVSAVGTEALRGLLNHHQIEPLSEWADLSIDPQNTILIVLGRTDLAIDRQFERFIGRGGSALIADDMPSFQVGRGPEPWVDSLGVGIAGLKLFSNRAEDCYDENEYCPFADPDAMGDDDDKDSPFRILTHPTELRKLNRIATNNPSYLYRINQKTVKPILGYPRSVRIRDNPEYRPARTDLAFAGATLNWPTDESGRVLVLADHSVFNNELMLPDAQDTDNFVFAENCIQWLQGDHPRKKCLFFEEGRVQKNFNVTFVELPTPPLPPLPVIANMLMQHGNKIISQLEDKDFFNQVLTRRWNYGRFLRGFVLVLTILLGCYGLIRLWKARTRVDSLIPVTRGFPVEKLKKRNSLETRQDSMFDRDNLYPSASAFVRERYAEMGLIPNAKGKPPRWKLTGSYFQNRRIRQKLWKLWQVAYGAKPITITSARWLKMASELEQLENDYDRGRWSVESTDEGTA